MEVERYDPYTDSWAPVGPAPKYVSNFSAAGCQGRLYLVGSSACKYNMLALQCYSPVTGRKATSLVACIPEVTRSSSWREAMVSGLGRRELPVHHVEMGAGQMQRLRGSQQPVGMRWHSGQVKAPSLLPAIPQ